MTEQRDPVTTVYVLHPERWWIATRADLPWLTDPDKDDGRVRWSDRDERQWGTIAGVIDAAGRALASGAHDVDQDDPTVAFVPVDLAGFAPADRNIVTSWFRAGSEAPSNRPVGGRTDERAASPLEHMAGGPGCAAAGLLRPAPVP